MVDSTTQAQCRNRASQQSTDSKWDRTSTLSTWTTKQCHGRTLVTSSFAAAADGEEGDAGSEYGGAADGKRGPGLG